jgi:thiol-disulfide isomerase/thioredoxin
MKKIYILFLTISFSCSKSITQTNHSQINQEVLDSGGGSMLLGRCSKGALLRQPYSAWFEKNRNEYQVDSSTLNSLKPHFEGITVEVFLGTWCGDTKRELPKFAKIQEQLAIPSSFFMLDEHKQSPLRNEAKQNIFKVPTFIIQKDGLEIGRIIEHPVESFEKDLAKILISKNYTAYYSGVPILTDIFDRNGIDFVVKNKVKVANQLKATIKKESELNAYGYVLMFAKNFDKALIVMELNTILFPNNPNTFDSLAEVYLEKGKKNKAIEYYEKALAINPDFESSKVMLKKLKY